MPTPGVSGSVIASSLLVTGPSFGATCVVNTDATTGAFTLSTADLLGAQEVYLALTGAQVGGVNVQVPTAAAVAAALAASIAAAPNPVGGSTISWYLRILNEGTGQILTITTNTGWTLNGTMTLANNTWRDFVVTLLPSGAMTLTNVGVGTFS